MDANLTQFEITAKENERNILESDDSDSISDIDNNVNKVNFVKSSKAMLDSSIKIESGKYSDSVLYEQSMVRMKIKIIDKINYRDLIENVIKNNPESICSDERWIEKAKIYNDNIKKIVSKFEVKDYPCVMITINAIDSKNWDDIIPLVNKFIKKNVIDYIYSLEQRGENEENIKGFHCHLMINRLTGNQRCIKNLRKYCITAFKSLFIGNPSFEQLNLKYVKPEKIQQYINYIKGVKKVDTNITAKKVNKIKIDKWLRNELGIPHFVCGGSFDVL